MTRLLRVVSGQFSGVIGVVEVSSVFVYETLEVQGLATLVIFTIYRGRFMIGNFIVLFLDRDSIFGRFVGRTGLALSIIFQIPWQVMFTKVLYS